MLSKWRPDGILYANGVGLVMLISSMSIKDRTVVGTSVRGARREPKDRLGLTVLAVGCS